MTVRRLSVSDAQFAALAVNTLKAPATRVTTSTLAQFLSRPQNVLLIADDHGTPTGFLVGYLLDRVDRDQRMICLYEIGVAAGHRQQGIGGALIEELKKLCRQENIMKCWVITDRTNAAAIRLYESTGAQHDGPDSLVFVYNPQS
jgi:ribosomal protein S18 acetylase RimI-like enzyme